MNRIHTALLAILILGVALSGNVLAGVVDQRDVDFVKTAWSSGAPVGGSPDAWASAGVVSRADLDFLSGDAGVVTASSAPAARPSVGTIDGADYSLIAGDGSPGATCDIALVAAINPGC